MKTIIIPIIVIIFSINIYAHCKITIIVKKINSSIDFNINTIRIFVFDNKIPLVNSENNFNREFKKTGSRKYEYETFQKDTILKISIQPFDKPLDILVTNIHELTIKLKISDAGIDVYYQDNNINKKINNVYKISSKIYQRLNQESLEYYNTKSLVDSSFILMLKELNKILDKNLYPYIYSEYYRKIKIFHTEALIRFCLMKQKQNEVYKYVVDFINNKNNMRLFDFDSYILASNFIFFLTKQINSFENSNNKIINYVFKTFIGSSRDIILAKLFEKTYYFKKYSKKNEQFLHTIIDSVGNKILKKQLLIFFKQYKSIYSIRAPSFTLPDSHGNLFSLDSILGNVIYLDFWGTWCPPCIKELPALEKLKSELKDYDIKFISIACEHFRKDKWLQAIKKYKLTDIQLYAEQCDYNVTVVKDYLTTYYPRFLIIDKAGKIINTDAPRPSDPKIKDILIKLSKHQKSKQ